MQRPRFLMPLIGSAVVGASVVAPRADDPTPVKSASPAPARVAMAAGQPFAAQEAAAMMLVRQQMPELLPILDPLRTSNQEEYRKAIAEIAAEARTLANLKSKNPARAALELDAWQKRIRVELIAAQLAASATPERAKQLREAIEARVDADIRRHKFEADQAENALVKAREHLARAEANRDRARDSLSRIEKNRDSKIAARFQALQPKRAVPATSKVAPFPIKDAGPVSTPLPATSIEPSP